jgi:16S rRNA (guanine(527)-N(7))-methyltransferase RsmG
VPTPSWFADLLPRELSPEQIDQLHEHYELLIRWNQRMNLTSMKPGPEMVVRHYSESLFFAAHLPAGQGAISVVDAGSGAGFPGVPMAVVKPAWHITLVESNQRKAVFLRESTRNLPNVGVLPRRLRGIDLASTWLVARAVNPAEVLENVPRIAANVGLMLSEEDFSPLEQDSRIAWSEPVRLPWGDRKICAYGMFHVERST